MSNWLETYCNSTTLWNDNLFENSSINLPTCFRYTLPVWIPTIYMLLLTPFSISTVQGFFQKGYLKKNKYNYSALYISKLCLSLLLIIVCVAEIVIYFTSQGSFENNDFIGGYVTPIIYGVTYLFYLVNEFYSHKYNQKRNGALWFYWLVELISKFIIFLSLVRDNVKILNVFAEYN